MGTATKTGALAQGIFGGGPGGGATAFTALTDATVVNLRAVNTPLDADLDAVEAAAAAKQAALVSGTNIKTINGASILGAGDIVISGAGGAELPLLSAVFGGQNITASEVALNSVLLPPELWRVGGGFDARIAASVAGTGTAAAKTLRLRLDNATTGATLATFAITLTTGTKAFDITVLATAVGASGQVQVTDATGAVLATVTVDTTVAHTLYATGQGTGTEGLLLNTLAPEAR